MENGKIIRTSENFQRKEWFSNVEITPAEDQEQFMSNKGSWYGKVSNLTSLKLLKEFLKFTKILFHRYNYY